MTAGRKAKEVAQPAPAKKAARWGVKVASAYLTTKHVVERGEEIQEGKRRVAGVTVDPLVLPREKGGPEAVAIWEGRAKAGALVAFVNVSEARSGAALWQEREGTDELRTRWRQRRGWGSDREVDKDWKAAGGLEEFPFVKSEGKRVAGQMDHIVELQVGGGNEDDNIQVLDGPANRTSGGAIKLEVFGLAEEVASRIGKEEGEQPDDVRLTFKNVVQAQEGKPPGEAYQVGLRCAPTGKATAEAASLQPYPIVAGRVEGGATATLRVKPGVEPTKLSTSEILENRSASQLISGLILETLERGQKEPDTIQAVLDASAKTRRPLPIEPLPGDKGKIPLSVAKQGFLSLKNKTLSLAFTYPYLSQGVITKLEVDDGGALGGEGQITPRAKFLPPLTIRFGRDQFSVVTALDASKLKPPFPGVRVTKAELGLDLVPEFRPRGTLELSMGGEGKGRRPLAEASFNVTRDDDGLVLDGTLRANLPGVDQAEAGFRYANQAWTGRIRLESSQLKLRYLKSGSIDVAIDQGGIVPSGELQLELPGGATATLAVTKVGSGWLYQGTGTFPSPRKEIQPVTASVSYDGETLKADGKTGFQFKGIDGRIHLFVRAGTDAVKYWGQASLSFAKGKAKGKLDPLKLGEDGRLTGKGEASYRLSEALEASAGIEVDEKEKVRFMGALVLTRPIVLFQRKGGQRELFRTPTLTIPIPGVSIGPAGLVVKIYGSLGVRYGLGPGQVQDARLEANFSPLEEDPDLDVALQGRLSIPATAGIDAAINGDVALDLLVASVSGGLAIVSSFDLGGEAFVEGKLRYSPRRLTAEGKAGVRAALDLQLGLKAHVEAQVGVAGLGAKVTKEWDLGKRTVPTGLTFGMAVPVKYASDQDFQLPALDQIEWTTPERIDVAQIVRNLLQGAPAKEGRA